MAIKTIYNTKISKNIVCVFRCHFCGEENILTQTVSETGASATTYQPLNKKNVVFICGYRLVIIRPSENNPVCKVDRLKNLS